MVDLGYGHSPQTTIELAAALQAVRPGVRVVGIENDRERVAAAQHATGDSLEFRFGGFELLPLNPVLVRAMNVLRQYDEGSVAESWAAMRAALAPGGLIVEGTCDETGRLGSWVTLDNTGPRTLTFAADLRAMGTPGDLAARLPKALIHRNVRGERIHDLLRAADDAWARAAPYAAFGPRQRWSQAAGVSRAAGWPVLDGPRRWRCGELTIEWSAVSPCT